MLREPVVYRQLAIPVSTFDHIKDTQRAIEARTGQRLSLTETFAAIAMEHKALTEGAAQQHQQQNAERGAHDHEHQEQGRSTSSR